MSPEGGRLLLVGHLRALPHWDKLEARMLGACVGRLSCCCPGRALAPHLDLAGPGLVDDRSVRILLFNHVSEMFLGKESLVYTCCHNAVNEDRCTITVAAVYDGVGSLVNNECWVKVLVQHSGCNTPNDTVDADPIEQLKSLVMMWAYSKHSELGAGRACCVNLKKT